MSNYEYEDDDDDFTTDSSNDLVKQLRKAAKQKDKELQELRAQFEGLNKAQRERAIKDALAARGVNQKISSFIPSDIDPTEESVSKWLEANADVFGLNVEPVQAVPNTDPADIAAYKRMTQTTEAGITPESGQDIMSRLMNANSKEELDAVIRESGL
jgi:ABC-type sugar transport system substrate-binding protein